MSQLPQPKKTTRAKAGHTKTARLSTQSVATVATAVSDLASVADITADHDDSVMTTTSVMTQGGRKTKTKKAPAAKGRRTRAKKDEAVEVLEDEAQTAQGPTPQKPIRGRKRASDAIEDVPNGDAPPPKKRATRVKKTPASQAVAPMSQDTEMADVKPATKKGRASAAKPTRKASQSSLRSQASTASLRGRVNDDDEIDRQLQADLERPFTDDENLDVDSESERREAPAPPPAPAKGGSKKTTTSRKAVAQTQSKAYAMLDPTPVEPNEAEIEEDLKTMETEMEPELPPAEPAETLTIPKKGRKPGPRKVSKQTKKPKAVVPSDPVDELMDDAVPEPTSIPGAFPEEAEEIQEVERGQAAEADTSTGMVVNNSSGRPSLEKRGRGRPPKRKTKSQEAAEDPEPRRSSGIPVQIEVQLESRSAKESFLESHKMPEKIPRKPVAAPSPAPDAIPASSTVPHQATVALPRLSEKALPPPPPASASRLPRPTTPREKSTPSASAKQAALSPSQSPQSSDAENRPPSSNAGAGHLGKRVVLAPVASTPKRTSPSKRNVVAGLRSTMSWTAVDLDLIFSPSDNKENGVDKLLRMGSDLTSPEKRMTVEEWIYHNAGLAEQKLKHECETMVSTFEREGSKAMRVLEGLIVD